MPISRRSSKVYPVITDILIVVPSINATRPTFIASSHRSIPHLTSTQCTSSQFVAYESDGIPTQGYTACSCNDIRKSVGSTYGSLFSIYNVYYSTWDTSTSLVLPLPSSFPIPRDCCVKCGVTAKGVHLFYWPIETGSKNVTARSATDVPQGFVSNGFTLSVGVSAPN